MRCGAFVDRSRMPQYTEKDYHLPENPPFSWLLRKPRLNSETEELSKSNNDENSSPNNNNLSARIAEASKLSHSPKDSISGTSPSSFKSRWSMRETKEDDKLLKELVSDDYERFSESFQLTFAFIFSIFHLQIHRHQLETWPNFIVNVSKRHN